MSGSQIELNELQRRVLTLVVAGKVSYSAGQFRLIEVGSPDVSRELQQLRAMKLVVLPQRERGRAVPPTRVCEPTDLGKQVHKQLCG